MNQIVDKITILCEQTKTEALKWAVIPDRCCVYSLQNGQTSCIVSCCPPETGFYMEVAGVKIDVPQSEVAKLCSAILRQIEGRKKQDNIERTVRALDSVMMPPVCC